MKPSESLNEKSNEADQLPGRLDLPGPFAGPRDSSSPLESAAVGPGLGPADEVFGHHGEVERLPLIVPAINRPASEQIENLLHLRSQAEQGNLSSACLSPTALTGAESPPRISSEQVGDSELTSPILTQPGSELRPSQPISTTGEVWKSLGWLAVMILVFLSAITVGPRVVEQYQYSAARGKMRAQYEAATDMLSKVSMRESALASELVVHRIRPSVVSIQAGSKQRNRSRQPMMRGQGSGIVISDDGMVVTNNHVIEKAEEIIVTLADRREFRATVIGRDVETDLAVLKIEASDLIPAEWGDSDELELGAPVWAMGSPFGLDQTVTRGIVSGKHRRTADNSGDANPHQDLLQTDAAVNPGNSGGPLVNSLGQVIGINTSIYGEFFQGISFAVPSSLAKEIVGKLIKSGHVQRGFLGVSPRDVTHADAIRLKLPEISGARLETVEQDAPAYRAGLRPDDVVVKIGGKSIDNHIMLFRQIALTSPGDETTIDFYRDGELSSAPVQVGVRPLYR
ncbi:MAG: trypsin-like peptidase domain-containing protein [Planctomycetaceae bacterium]|nr:trypsin-like peptidase domain-containing protein [Planctomycetaceae bacterium]